MKSSLLCLQSLLFILGCGTSFLHAKGPLVELARPGPWAGVSKLIAYDSRLYMVNSEVYVNHNSADIYSYHPLKRESRFEHRLFSQDAGTPVVIDGLLYWPYEDPRFSAGNGEYEVTDGTRWQWQVIPQIYGFHLHGMSRHQKTIYAIASAWEGRIYRSEDQMKSWQLLYEHSMPPRRVSRVNAMQALGDSLYFALTAKTEIGVKLLFMKNSQSPVIPVPGWPNGQSLGPMIAYKNWIYAVNKTKGNHQLWRTNGHTSAEPIPDLDAYRLNAFGATPDSLWAVGQQDSEGFLWRSSDGQSWKQVQQFSSPVIAMTTVASEVYVGTYEPDQGGRLWGPRHPKGFGTSPLPKKLPDQPIQRLKPTTLRKAFNELDDLIAKTSEGHHEYRNQILDHLLPLALSHDPAVGKALSLKLNGTFPQTRVPLFGKIKVPAKQLVQWYLLYSIAINGHGFIPPQLILTPWQSPRNRAEKYLEPSIASAWAATQLQQSDSATIAALKKALEGNHPVWAKQDFRTALQVLDH